MKNGMEAATSGAQRRKSPLSIRIFALVDVFVCSPTTEPTEKPGRATKPWSPFKKGGWRFRLQVVDTFFEYLQGEVSKEISSQP